MEIKQHSVVFLIGPSCCGKSFFAQKTQILLQQQGVNSAILSSDDARRWLLNDPKIKKHDSRMMYATAGAFKFLCSQLIALTNYPINTDVVFIDATNLSQENRADFVQIAKDNGYYTYGVVFKFKSRKKYFRFVQQDDNTRIVSKHVDRLYKETLSSLGDLDYKIFLDEYTMDSDQPSLIKTNEHCVLSNNQDYMIIGDIHGVYDKMTQALSLAEAENVIPIFLGDFLDKNSVKNCAEVIRLLHAYQKPVYWTTSNHDEAAYGWLMGDGRYSEAVMKQYFPTVFDLDEDTKLKFKELYEKAQPFYLHDRFIASHAPVKARALGKLKFAKQHRSFRYPKMDEFVSREEWSKEITKQFHEMEGDEFGFPYHVFGHVIVEKPYKSKSFLAIDTGACYGGDLSYVIFKKDNTRPYIGCIPGSPIKNAVITSAPIRTYNINNFDRRNKGRVLFAAEHELPVTSGTVCPADQLNGELESLQWAYNYYDGSVVLQPKYMGSWSLVRLHQDAKKCKAFSRNGYLIQNLPNTIFEKLINQITWNNIEEIILGAELMPWSFLGKGLINKSFYGMHFLQQKQINAMLENGFCEALGKLNSLDLSDSKRDIIEKYGQHMWKTAEVKRMLEKESLNPYNLNMDNWKFKEQIDLYGSSTVEPYFEPFLIYKIVFTNSNEKNLMFNNIFAQNLFGTDFSIPASLEEALAYFESLTTIKSYEGVVVKPLVRNDSKAPYIKVRNSEYLRLIYGYDYQRYLDYHRTKKHIGRKLKESIIDWQRAVKMNTIPVGELNKNNKEYMNLLADFVIGEQRQSEIDPRL